MRILIARATRSINSDEMTHADYVVALRAVALAVGRIESIHRSRRAIYANQTTLDKVWGELKYLRPEED